ncbi:MAG: transposase [Bacteroidetes bacterium]|nr:transposase [Bacteroidota bacterium]
MARPLRIEYKGAFYHITSRGNDRQDIFFSKSDYKKFKDYLIQSQEKYGYNLHCYMLMTNHYHLIIETPNANMSKIMHYVNGSYTSYINRCRRKYGHLFQGRYKAILIDRDPYLLELSRYIHLNPVRAGMVERPENYTYGSYRDYVRKNKDEELVYKDLILKMVSQNSDGVKRYKAFVERGMNEEQENPFKDIFAGSILGNKFFIKEALNELKDNVFQKKEISYRKDLDSAFTAEIIIKTIADYFNVHDKDIFKKKGEYRKVAIFFLKRKTSLSNRQIGEMFGGLSYSAVAKVNERFTKVIGTNRRVKKDIVKISKKMSYVKG